MRIESLRTWQRMQVVSIARQGDGVIGPLEDSRRSGRLQGGDENVTFCWKVAALTRKKRILMNVRSLEEGGSVIQHNEAGCNEDLVRDSKEAHT